MDIRLGTERDLTHPDCVAEEAHVERGEADKGEAVQRLCHSRLHRGEEK